MSTEEKKPYCRQNLNLFVKEFITRCKNGPRAIFKCTEGEREIVYRDVPQDGQNFTKIMKAQPETLVGIYDGRIKPEHLFADLRLN